MKLVFKKLTSFVMMIVLTVALFVPVIQVSAASVGLNKTKIVIVVGQKYRLTLNGTKKAPTWKTSNKKVVTVKKDGSVTGVSKGTANVTATLGKKTYKCKVIVEAPKISLTKKTINAGEKFTLKLNGTTKSVKWTTSNKKVATVSQNGVVKGIAKGTANIIATVGGKKYVCKVTVETPKISLTNKTIDTGEKFTLKLNGTTRSVKWTTSNKKVATVSQNGVVKGIAKGTANITATAGGKKYVCKVTVKEPRILSVSTNELTITDKGTITVTYKGSGTITYYIDNTDIIDCKWSEGFDGDNCKLYVTALKYGKAKIIITDNESDEICIIKVNSNKKSSIISVSTNELTITDEGIITVTYKGNGDIRYDIDNDDIIKCKWSEKWDGYSCELYVTALKYGKATITITDGESDEICIIKVNSNKKSSIISVSTNELTITDEGTITVTYKGNGKIRYDIDNDDIIKCKWSEGWDGDSCKLYVTALKYGKATITITDSESDEICIIKVNSNKRSSTVDNFNELKSYINSYGRLNSDSNKFIVRELEDDDYEYNFGIVYNSANDTLNFICLIERKDSNGIETALSFEIDPYSSYSDIDAIVSYYSNNDLDGMASANAILPIKKYDGQTNLNFVFSSDSDSYLTTDSVKRLLNSSLKLAFTSWNILILSTVGLTLNDIGFTSYVAR